MGNSAASLKTQFDLQTRLFCNVLQDITNAESDSRNNENINHMKWVAGHLLNTRLNLMSKIAGLQPDESYVAKFARGTSLDPNGSYPAIDEITSKWQAVSPILSESIAKIPEEVWNAKAPAQTPVADDTIRGMFSFLISHESYHIGQLSILRKMVGKEAMSYQ